MTTEKKETMTVLDALLDLRSRGECNIKFDPETGVFTSQHGKYTTNFWVISGHELKCIDCKTRYS